MNNYIAEIDPNNQVVRVIVCDSVAWAEKNLGGVWLPTEKKTSTGFTYDRERDAFIPPKPFDSWVLDESTFLWEAPVEYPQDGEDYIWNEETISWDLVVSDS